MNIRNAVAEDLPAIVEIPNPNVPTRVSTADTEHVSVEDRTAWFHEHDPSRRPLRVTENRESIPGWLSRPAYHATAEVCVYVRQGRRLVEEAIRRALGLGLKTLTAGIFAHNRSSVALFDGFGTCARCPNVAELDGGEPNLPVLGPRYPDDPKERAVLALPTQTPATRSAVPRAAPAHTRAPAGRPVEETG